MAVTLDDLCSPVAESPFLPPAPGFIDFPGVGTLTQPVGGLAGTGGGRVASSARGRILHTTKGSP